MGGPRVDALWHKDAKGMSDPQKLEGKRYFHSATSALYMVTGYTLDVTGKDGPVWSITYRRSLVMEGEFEFSRAMWEFLDGRFVEVK